MKQALFDFMFFLLRTERIQGGIDESINSKFLFICKAFLITILFKTIIAYIIIILSKYGLIESTKGSGNLSSWLSEVSDMKFIVQVIVLAPLMEEVAFRGIIQSDQLTVSIAVGVLCYLITCVVIHNSFYSFTGRTLYVIGFSIIFGVVFYKIDSFYTINLNFDCVTSRFVIWLSACGFALWHYNNFDFSKAHFHTIVLTLLPYFLSGLVLSWTSLSYGLKWSITLHVLNNALPVLITIWRANHTGKVV